MSLLRNKHKQEYSSREWALKAGRSPPRNEQWKHLNIVPVKTICSLKLEKWGMNQLPSDYEADMLTIWLKAWTASHAASSLPILIELFYTSKHHVFLMEPPCEQGRYTKKETKYRRVMLDYWGWWGNAGNDVC